jgi:hypothetical protein
MEKDVRETGFMEKMDLKESLIGHALLYLASWQERLSENAHLPLDKLMALSKAEGLRYPHPSSLRRTFMYASFLGISEALHMDIFHQPLKRRLFHSVVDYLFVFWELWVMKKGFTGAVICHST